MLLKTRVRVYDPNTKDAITQYMLDFNLAQNVSQEQQFLTGDFVSTKTIIGDIFDYMYHVRKLNQEFGVEAEVVPG